MSAVGLERFLAEIDACGRSGGVASRVDVCGERDRRRCDLQRASDL